MACTGPQNSTHFKINFTAILHSDHEWPQIRENEVNYKIPFLAPAWMQNMLKMPTDSTTATVSSSLKMLNQNIAVGQHVKQLAQLLQRNCTAGWVKFWPKYEVVSLSEFFCFFCLINLGWFVKVQWQHWLCPVASAATDAHCSHMSWNVIFISRNPRSCNASIYIS